MKLRFPIMAAAAAVIVAAVCGWSFYDAMWGYRLPMDVAFEIDEGQSASRVLAELERRNVVPSARAARLYLRMWASQRAFHHGRFNFPAGSRPIDVVERVLEGEVEMVTVTVIEGSDRSEISRTMSAAGIGTDDDWIAIVDSALWLAELAPAATSLEGFLFPDTYRFAVGTSAERAARHLVDTFLEVWREETAALTEPWASVLEIVTLASMVEAETSIDDERARIAGVFVNRLRRGMLLQCDPTVVYALKRTHQWQGRLLRIHWKLDDPYNTYRYGGLPPGPINSPGRASLSAALNPAATPELYFVANPDGGHTFSTTLAAHNRAVARLLASRR